VIAPNNSIRTRFAARLNSGVRRHMKLLDTFWLIALATLAMTSCSSSPKIDGSSKVAFERSHAALVASLSPEDQLRLSLAELIVLSTTGCLTTKPMPNQPFLNEMLGGQADLSSCRQELHGLTFRSIMELAYPHGYQAGGSALVPPNTSFKPNPLRGSA